MDEDYVSQCEQYALQIEDLQLKLRNILEELEFETTSKNQCQSKLRDLENKNDALEQQVVRLVQDLRIKEAASKESEDELQKLRKKSDELSASLVRLKKEKNDLVGERDSISIKMLSIEQEWADKVRDLEIQTTKLARENQHRLELSDTIGSLQRENSELKTQLANH